MRKTARPRRIAALLTIAVLHGLLAIWAASKSAPPAVDPPTVEVVLVRLPPKPPPKPDAPTPEPDAPARVALPAPPAGVERRATPTTDWTVRADEPAEAGRARATLRKRLGCRSADLLALTADERAACEDELARGAQDAPTYAVISPKLKKVFDKTFECPKGDVWCEYRTGKAPYPGLFAPRRERDRSWD
ncbi:MAG: hypothetical protein DI570_09025 [Phenylobacterium zucineum]|nr:MAG: hypothetical protein DI570_09025 [Phenylobacterium zucineum]